MLLTVGVACLAIAVLKRKDEHHRQQVARLESQTRLSEMLNQVVVLNDVDEVKKALESFISEGLGQKMQLDVRLDPGLFADGVETSLRTSEYVRTFERVHSRERIGKRIVRRVGRALFCVARVPAGRNAVPPFCRPFIGFGDPACSKNGGTPQIIRDEQLRDGRHHRIGSITGQYLQSRHGRDHDCVAR